MIPAAPFGVLWDTTFASRLRPSRPVLLGAALLARGTSSEPLLGAPVVAEVVYGLRKGVADNPEFAAVELWWETHILAGPDHLQVVMPSLNALILAARVRARQPSSPVKARKKDGRKDPERRVSWSRDIELATIAVTLGLPVATANRSDFEPIAKLLADEVPRLPPLELQDAPA